MCLAPPPLRKRCEAKPLSCSLLASVRGSARYEPRGGVEATDSRPRMFRQRAPANSVADVRSARLRKTAISTVVLCCHHREFTRLTLWPALLHAEIHAVKASSIISRRSLGHVSGARTQCGARSRTVTHTPQATKHLAQPLCNQH